MGRAHAAVMEFLMLVYCSLLTLEPKDGVERIVATVARWVGQKTQSFVDPGSLRKELQQRLKDGSTVFSVSSSSGPSFLCAISFTHGDTKVAGRQWITEVGIRQETPEDPVDCSILLKTNEVSARVIEPIQVTRPRIVEYLVKECLPSSSTPGLRERRLDEEGARDFLKSVEDERRRTPYVVVSATTEGHYIAAPSRLASLLVGVADIFVIPHQADTFEIEHLVGSKYSAWRGAINVIFAPRKMGQATFVECVRLLPDALLATYEEGNSPDSEVLSVVSHRTNLPNSWRHISPETVMRHRLRAQLSASIGKARAASLSQQEYVALLEEADKELHQKDEDLISLREDVEEKDSEIRRLEYAIEGLKAALSGRDSEVGTVEDKSVISSVSFKSAFVALQNQNPSVEQSLQLIRAIYPDRVTVLEPAYASAKDSENFKHRMKAFHLLWKLATQYWEALHGGSGDANAKKIFGESFAAREAETMSNQGLKRRTFQYKDQQIEMLKHLRIGVKDSPFETLRIHFHWDAKDQRILIGH